MHLGLLNPKYEYNTCDKSNNINLSETQNEKDLGVNVDNTLTFSDHIHRAANKANGILAMIRRCYTYLDSDVVRSLYQHSLTAFRVIVTKLIY